MRGMYSKAAGQDFGSAGEYFAFVREASRECESSTRQLAALNDGWRPQGMTEAVSGGFTTDKSGMLVGRMMQADMLRERIELDEAIMDEATAVIYGKDKRSGLSSMMGSAIGDLMWWRYLGLESWSCLGETLGKSPRWCQLAVNAALDFVDSHGLTDTMLGEGHAD